jgi:hypothetical protein
MFVPATLLCSFLVAVSQGFSPVPHSMQNFAPGAGVVPHFGQVAGRSDAPHSLQNFALAGSVALHLGHGLVCAAGCGATGA